MNKKVIIITVLSCVLVVGLFIGAKYFLNKYKSKNIATSNDTIKVLSEVPNEDTLTNQIVLDSIDTVDSTEFFENEIKDELIEDIPTTPTTKPRKRINNENKVNNWILVEEKGLDTIYFCIKNKVTGTKLSNRYYSKDKADTELINFKKILEVN
jgi:hypothetical protein